MSKLQSNDRKKLRSNFSQVKGVLKTFWQMTLEDWYETDRKLFKIITAAVSFTIAALFWLFFFSNIRPF
ncbi:MAG: hypothetical protein HZB67_05970 [Candidatus Aenigmarchaeota archaeon]|nr:hypothetical protein [Candidatus Aenigmarchaeota archaeon]